MDFSRSIERHKCAYVGVSGEREGITRANWIKAIEDDNQRCEDAVDSSFRATGKD
jgi:hypothetical protein